MATDLYIPKLGQTVEEVTLIRWLVEDGQEVERGQEVLEVETDKAVFNVEATGDGFIHLGPFKEGSVLPVLTTVAVIGKIDDIFVKVPAPENTEAKPLTSTEKEPESVFQKSTTVEHLEKTFISPRARRLAAANDIDLSQIKATGAGGSRITESDVRKYISGKAAVNRKEESKKETAISLPPPEIAETKSMRGIRGVTAAHMAASSRATARVTLFSEVDATNLVHLREQLKLKVSSDWGFAPGYNDLFAFICARLLRKYSYMNARLNGELIEMLQPMNIGIAVDDERGLFVPVVNNADGIGLRDLGIEFRRLLEAIRSGTVSPDDLSGGTFTITNLGGFGVEGFTPIINLPEAAILGIGRITPKPVVLDKSVVIRSMVTLSLAFDHRLVDGAPAAKFLQAVGEAVANPEILFVFD